jgi:hypothetical protein
VNDFGPTDIWKISYLKYNRRRLKSNLNGTY